MLITEHKLTQRQEARLNDLVYFRGGPDQRMASTKATTTKQLIDMGLLELRNEGRQVYPTTKGVLHAKALQPVSSLTQKGEFD